MPATDALYLPDENDRKLLKEMLLWFANDRANTTNRLRTEEPDIQAPEVYLAMTPAGGIPGLVKTTGTGSIEDVTAGSAVCEMWRLSFVNNHLHPLGFSKTVWNLSTTAVAGGTPVLVVRDKPGIWYATAPGTSGGGGSLTVEDEDANTVTSVTDLVFQGNGSVQPTVTPNGGTGTANVTYNVSDGGTGDLQFCDNVVGTDALFNALDLMSALGWTSSVVVFNLALTNAGYPGLSITNAGLKWQLGANGGNITGTNTDSTWVINDARSSGAATHLGIVNNASNNCLMQVGRTGGSDTITLVGHVINIGQSSSSDSISVNGCGFSWTTTTTTSGVMVLTNTVYQTSMPANGCGVISKSTASGFTNCYGALDVQTSPALYPFTATFIAVLGLNARSGAGVLTWGAVGDDSYAFNAIAGNVFANGTPSNNAIGAGTFEWGSDTTSPGTTTLGSLPLTVYGTGADILTTPADWALVRVNGTYRRIPVY